MACSWEPVASISVSRAGAGVAFCDVPARFVGEQSNLMNAMPMPPPTGGSSGMDSDRDSRDSRDRDTSAGSGGGGNSSSRQGSGSGHTGGGRGTSGPAPHQCTHNHSAGNQCPLHNHQFYGFNSPAGTPTPAGAVSSGSSNTLPASIAGPASRASVSTSGSSGSPQVQLRPGPMNLQQPQQSQPAAGSAMTNLSSSSAPTQLLASSPSSPPVAVSFVGTNVGTSSFPVVSSATPPGHTHRSHSTTTQGGGGRDRDILSAPAPQHSHLHHQQSMGSVIATAGVPVQHQAMQQD